MLIVGAKGFAKEVLEVCHQNGDLEHVVFYDDVNDDIEDELYGKFLVLKNLDQAREYFSTKDRRFTLGLGNPALRKKIADIFENIGGVLTSTISPKATIGNYGNTIQYGCNIMSGTVITNDVNLGKGVLLNLNCTIGHDSVIGDFVEISPGCNISGNCIIGDYCNLGTNTVLLPNIQLGKNVIVGAGAVVTKDIPDNSLAVGIPAKVVKSLNPIEL